MKTAIVTGGGSGLGLDITLALAEKGFNVMIADLKNGVDVRDPSNLVLPEGGLDVLINCAGINQISWLEGITDQLWDDTLDVNAKGIMKVTQRCLPALVEAKGTVLNIVSNASHMPMRGSLAYNASKGAAHIMTLQMARELYQRWGITVFGISPNKLANTAMSRDIDEQVCQQRGWSMEEARKYQLAGLATGEETDPVVLAEFITFLLSRKERHQFLHGTVIPYGA